MPKMLKRRYGKTNSGNREETVRLQRRHKQRRTGINPSCHIHQSAAVETVRDERTAGLALGSCRGDNDRVERIFRRERDENTVGVVEGALEVFD
jgi:hypothetical protein